MWYEDLYKNKRWLFWLLLPVILILLFKDVIFQALVSSAKATVDEAEKKDKELSKESNKAEVESGKAEAKAEVIEEKIKDRDDSDIPLDWHKRK